MVIVWWRSDWTVVELTQEQLQKNCVHVFRDIETTETYIKSKCIRCWLERTYNITN